MSVAWVGAGIAAVGTISSMSASKSATNAQRDSANQANDTQRYQYDTTRADNAPFLANGTAGSNRLAYLLGLNSGGANGSTNAMTRDQIRSELLPQYTSTASGAPADSGASGIPTDSPFWLLAQQYREDANPGGSGAQTQAIDQTGLNAAIDKRLADQLADQQKTQAAAMSDPAYGSLLRRFSMSDLNSDPVYQNGLQFGLREGEKAINHQAAAVGGALSGATLKALARYANDYGSTKAEGAYNRYNTDQTNQYNRLAGISGTGQTASNLVATAGANMANNVSANQIGMGNARASSYIAGANGINNALSTGVNAYQQQKVLSSMQGNNNFWNTGGGYDTASSLGGFYPGGGNSLDYGNMS